MTRTRTFFAQMRSQAIDSRVWLRILAVFVLLCLMAVVLSALYFIYIDHRIQRLDIKLTGTSYENKNRRPEAETWLIVGTDDRSSAPEYQELYTSGAQEGRRADVLLLVKKQRTHLTVLSLHRDLDVGPEEDVELVKNTLRVSPQHMVDTFCSELNIPIDHVVLVTMDAFVQTVDMLGGISVSFDYPIRDARTGLDLNAGTHLLDGRTTLMYMRSHRPEYYVDGKWIAVGGFAGTRVRQQASAQVMGILLEKVQEEQGPLLIGGLAWIGRSTVSLDNSTHVSDILSFFDTVAISESVGTLPNGDGSTRLTAKGQAALKNADVMSTCSLLRAAGGDEEKKDEF
ncbi:MAG: hypothetical protein CSB13_09390 [Chloroflexi bacterium]|nr:MAG: hypothetical protein CSB13_09390 [Chloroflexota bacterium]